MPNPYWTFAKVFGPWLVVLALVFVVLFMRGDMVKFKAERDAAKTEVTRLDGINRQNAATMSRIAQATEDNARIATEVQADLADIRARGNTTRVTIQEASRNDPTVRAWADTPVPGVVRDALSAPASTD
jgi:hypothetical protein